MIWVCQVSATELHPSSISAQKKRRAFSPVIFIVLLVGLTGSSNTSFLLLILHKDPNRGPDGFLVALNFQVPGWLKTPGCRPPTGLLLVTEVGNIPTGLSSGQHCGAAEAGYQPKKWLLSDSTHGGWTSLNQGHQLGFVDNRKGLAPGRENMAETQKSHKAETQR